MMNHHNRIIRLAGESDAENIWEIYKPYVMNTFVTFETDIPALSVFRSRMEDILHTLPWLVCEYDNRMAGYAYATDHRSRKAYQWTKELSVYIHDDFKRKGIATGLYTTLFQLLKIQGVKNCLAGIALPNEASIRFHEKMGFRKVGVYHQIGYKLNDYRDVGWWELFVGQKNEPPDGILPINSIVGSDEFNLAIRMGLEYLY
jgi:L-amino acid N-acyltransferase YncA